MSGDWNNGDHHGQHHHLHSRSMSGMMPMSYEPSGNGSSSSSTQGGKSTKGASKMRRDLINNEIANLRDLLPLPSSTRQRLSQLQLMALVLVYVRKSNYFDQVYKMIGRESYRVETPSIGFSKALNGFLMMTTQTGKLLYISDNAAEYLGHSMEDLLIHGDSVYDIIDKQDHAAIQAELMRGLQQNSHDHGLPDLDDLPHERRIFLCRINVSRNARRQMRFGDQKVVLIEGRFSGVLPLCSRNEPVFLSWCTPIAMPETRECVVQGATNIFTTIHAMDFKVNNIDANGEFYLGYAKFDLQGVSWYNFIHPDCLKEVQSKLRLITQSESERSCILLLRLQRRDSSWLWVHTVLQVKENVDSSQSSVIVCTNQVLSEREARVMKANSWLYHYYMVQSRLQYSLAYGGQSPTSMGPFYPQPPFGSPQSFDGSTLLHGHPSSSAFMPQTSPANHHQALHGYNSGYTYTPPPGAYHLHNEQMHHGHHTGKNGGGVSDRSSESPLDFSSTTNGGYGNWNHDSHFSDGMQDSKSQSFTMTNTEIQTKYQSLSSPNCRSDSSSTSPHQLTILEAGTTSRAIEGHTSSINCSSSTHFVGNNYWDTSCQTISNSLKMSPNKCWKPMNFDSNNNNEKSNHQSST